MGNSNDAADVINTDPAAYSVEELYDILAGRSDRLPSVVALDVLRRKRYPAEEKLADFQRILLDEAAAPRLRTAAGVALGRLGTPAARTVLAAQATSKVPLLNRAARLGLQEMVRLQGAPAAAATADQTEDGGQPALAAAMALPAGPPLAMDHDRAEAITHRKAAEKTAAQIVRDLQREAPGLALEPATARTVRCAGRTLAFVAAKAAAAMSAALDAPVVVGVVAARETVETNRWTARYTLLAGSGEQPGTVALRLVSGRGRVVMVGEATVARGRASFTLRAVEGPGNAPAEVVGSYEAAGRLRLSEARSEPRIAQKLTPGRR